MATQRGKSFAADMKAAPKQKPRSPFVEYDAAGSARNPTVPPSSPYATMKKGRPVGAAASSTLNSKNAQGMQDVGQTLADTYRLDKNPQPWQTAVTGKKKKGGK